MYGGSNYSNEWVIPILIPIPNTYCHFVFIKKKISKTNFLVQELLTTFIRLFLSE